MSRNASCPGTAGRSCASLSTGLEASGDYFLSAFAWSCCLSPGLLALEHLLYLGVLVGLLLPRSHAGLSP